MTAHELDCDMDINDRVESAGGVNHSVSESSFGKKVLISAT